MNYSALFFSAFPDPLLPRRKPYLYTVVPAGRDPAEFFPVRLAEIPEMTWHGPHPARLPPGGETWAEDERGLFEVHRVQ